MVKVLHSENDKLPVHSST